MAIKICVSVLFSVCLALSVAAIEKHANKEQAALENKENSVPKAEICESYCAKQSATDASESDVAKLNAAETIESGDVKSEGEAISLGLATFLVSLSACLAMVMVSYDREKMIEKC